MKVRELIEELKNVDQEAEVFIWNYAHSNYESLLGEIDVGWDDEFGVVGCMIR